jgi:hypothetical protein
MANTAFGSEPIDPARGNEQPIWSPIKIRRDGLGPGQQCWLATAGKPG